MEPDSAKPLETILDASQECLDLFQSSLLRSTDAVAELEAAERQFRAWTNTLKVFSQSASLDTQLRVKKYDQIRQMVMVLLDVLKENQSLVLRLVSSDQSAPFAKSSLGIPLFGINESLKRLDKAAAVILQASQGSLIKRTIVFAEKHDDLKRLVGIFSMIILTRYRGLGPKDKLGNTALEMTESLIPTKEKVLAQRPEGLFLALVKTSVVRHFRILYERNRRDREKRVLMGSRVGPSTSQRPNLADGDIIQEQCKPLQSNKSTSGEANQVVEQHEEAKSEKQPTVLSIDVDDYKKGIARIDSASVNAHEKSAPPISEAGVASYPRAPKIPYGQEHGICPICKQVFPAEELKGANWLAHAIKDIQPYVCIFEICMSNIQFFERRRDWIDHMHKVHTPLWIRYLHNPLTWSCSLCYSDSNAEFISVEEAKTSFREHLERSHPHTEKTEWQHLVSSRVVPQPRSSEYCPICGIFHQPRAIPFEFQSDGMKGNMSAGTQNSGAMGTEDASESQHKSKVRFAAPETPNGEDEECPAENSSLNPPNWRSTRATDDHGVENCIAEHLRALALNFSARLINDDDDDDERDSDVPSGQSFDSERFELEDLPEVGSEDDPPRVPSGKCDEIDMFPIQSEDKVEMKKCILENFKDLHLESDKQINWNFNWHKGYRVIEPNISDEERERLFPDTGIDWDLWSRISKELKYCEIRSTTELPFEIPLKYLHNDNATIMPVKAKPRNTRRQYVMKKVYIEPESGEGVDERTKNLCRKAAMALWDARHQHVIRVFMAFTLESNDNDDEERPYFGIIMELAEQGDITRHLACQRSPAETEKISSWFGCLANATAYIHSIGISHRDIKPSNILLRKDGTVVLADFSISKMGLGKTLSTTTLDDPRVNTPRYAAPEVGEGGARGRQADIFSLGAVFFEMLIAHSFKDLRPELSTKIKSRKERARSGQAYAPFLRDVHDWMNEIQGTLECAEEHWHRSILRLCLEMTSEIRESRPSAEEVYSIISGSESLKKEAGLNCNCGMASVQTESQRLIKACQRPNGYDEVKALLENKQNLQTKGAIQQAASHDLFHVVLQFLHRGADVNQIDHGDQTALHCAAAKGCASVVKLLLHYGAKIDIKDEEEQLPLHCASRHGQIEIVEALLEHDTTGHTVLNRDYYGQMPLHCAAKRGFTDVVRFLIGKMNNNAIMETDARQRTALHLAAGYGSEAVVQLLLDAVTDKNVINSLDENNMTALHWATIGRQRDGNYVKVMEMLLERGADVHIRGGTGHKTAINHARDHQDEERIAILLHAEKKAQQESGAQLVADSAPDINEMTDILLQEIEHLGQYVDADVKKIKIKLLECNNSWSQLARICMILLNIQVRKGALPDILRKFEDQSLSDYHLPIRTIDLTKVLSPSLCKRFQDEQEKALIQVFRFEEREEHYNLKTDDWNSNFENKGDLGGGGSSKVAKVSNKDTGDIYAVKLITRTGGDNEKRAAAELKMLKRVRHIHIVSFVGSFTSPRYFGLLMVPAAEFNLAAYLNAASCDAAKRSYLPSFCGCLVNALHHLHYVSHMTHNNIKPENILIHNGNVLLTDFGVSLDWSETLRTTMFSPATITSIYCAPEVTNEGQLRDSNSDIWSLGCVFLEIISVFIGRKVDDIKQFLKTKNPANQTYNRNSIAIQQWIKILERENGPLLGWLGSMLEHNPSSRPNISQLLDTLNELSICGKSYFGKCCRAKRLVEVQIDEGNPQQPEGDDAGVLIEQHSKVAAVTWPGECRVYFQDTDGRIYETICFDEEQQWRGAHQPKDEIARAKRCSPITATAWRESAGHRQPRVHVYFVNEENLLQERIWDPMINWIDGSLNALKVEIPPSSQLSATSWGDGNIMLCYQGSNNAIHILDGWAHDAIWRRGTTIEQADSHSPLSVTNFEHLGFRAARLYFKLNGIIREACWDEVRDDVRAPPGYYMGGCYKDSPENASISALAWKSESLEMRIYIASREILHETRYSGGWIHFDLSPESEERDGHIAAVRSTTGIIHIFSIEQTGLTQVTRSDGVWTKKHILTKAGCLTTERLHNR